ncbi:MAG: FtsX-like permease family protein, partial [Terriglobales bacterium]
DYAASTIHTAPQALALNQQILARLQALPRVQAAALTTLAPLRGQGNVPAEPAGHAELGNSVEVRAVSPRFFESLRIPLRAGRGIEEGDTASSPRVVVINEALAHAWYGGHAVGGRLRIGAIGSKVYMPGFDDAREVVGVVGDIRAVRLDRPARLTAYMPFTQDASPSLDWIVRGSGVGLAAHIRDTVNAVSPSTRVSGLQPYPALLGAVVAQPRFLAQLLGLLAGFALLLTALGLYGVLAYAVAQRTREIGVRMALGADAGRLRRSVIGRGLWVAGAGMIAGYGAAIPLAGLLRGLIYGIRPQDPVSLIGAGGLLLLIALAASWVPARRATRVDPALALRAE